MINNVEIIGRLGMDPDDGVTANGNVWARVSVATNNGYYDRDKQQYIEQPPDWHNVTAWGHMAKKLATMKKGDMVYLSGSLKYQERTEDGRKIKYAQVLAEKILNLSGGSSGNSSKPPLPTEDDMPANYDRMKRQIEKNEQIIGVPTDPEGGDPPF